MLTVTRVFTHQRLPASSTVNSHIPEVYRIVDLTAAAHTRPLVDNQTTYRHYRWLKLSETSWVLCKCESVRPIFHHHMRYNHRSS